MEDGQYVPGSIYFYAPNKAAPVFFATCFAVSGCVHAYQCIKYKSWQLTGLYAITSVLFVGGFILRELGAFDYSNLIKYIVSICLIYAAPPIYELANYNILGRILYYVPYHSPIHPGRVLTTFAFISSVVEAISGNGAAYSANTSLPQSKQDIGKALLKAALLMQLVVEALFVLLAIIFHRRCHAAGIHNPGLEKALHTLYASTALISVRTLYRTIEYYAVAQLHVHEGMSIYEISPLIRYEWFFYVFEASLMLCNQVMLNVRHPRMFLPQSTKIYLAKDGVTEVKGPGYKDPRPVWLTVVDPMDIHALITGRHRMDKFWEEQEQEQETAMAKSGDKSVAPRNPEDPEAA